MKEEPARARELRIVRRYDERHIIINGIRYIPLRIIRRYEHYNVLTTEGVDCNRHDFYGPGNKYMMFQPRPRYLYGRETIKNSWRQFIPRTWYRITDFRKGVTNYCISREGFRNSLDRKPSEGYIIYFPNVL